MSPSTCVTAGLCCILPNAPISHVTKAGYSHAHKKKGFRFRLLSLHVLKKYVPMPNIIEKKNTRPSILFLPSMEWSGYMRLECDVCLFSHNFVMDTRISV